MTGIMQRVMMLIAATSSVLFQLGEYAGHDLVAYGVIHVGYMSVWSIGRGVVLPVIRGFPTYQYLLPCQLSSNGGDVDARDSPRLPMMASDSVESNEEGKTQSFSAPFWSTPSSKSAVKNGHSRKTAFARRGAQSGARIAQVLPPSAIGREIPVSSKRNKKSASPSKTIASGVGLHSGTVDVDGQQEGKATINEFLIAPRMDNGEPTTGGGVIFAVELYKVGVDEGIEWESDGGVSLYTPLAQGEAPPLSLRLESCGRDPAGNAKTLTEVECHSAGTTGPVPATENAQLNGYYIGSYKASTPGRYKTSITQLLPGGLEARFWPNGWLLGTPIVRRVDPEIAFNWGLNAVVPFSEFPVSARWEGKLLAPVSDLYTIVIKAHGGIRLFLDHRLVIDAWEDNLRATKERQMSVDLIEGQFHDLVLEYREEGGSASVQVMWASRSIPPSVIPSWALFYATPITGSPFDVTVSPRGADSPSTDTYEKGLGGLLAGEGKQTSVQAKEEGRKQLDRDKERDNVTDIALTYGPEERRKKFDRDKENDNVTDIAFNYGPIRGPRTPNPNEDQASTMCKDTVFYVEHYASSANNVGFCPWYFAEPPWGNSLKVAGEAGVQAVMDSDNSVALSVPTGVADFPVAATDMPLVVSSAPPNRGWADQACTVQALGCTGLSNRIPDSVHLGIGYTAPASVEGCFFVSRDHHFAFPNDGNGVDFDALCLSPPEMRRRTDTTEDSHTSVAGLSVSPRTPDFSVEASDMAWTVSTASPDKGWPGQTSSVESREGSVYLGGLPITPGSSGSCVRGSYGYLLTFPTDGNIVIRASWLCLSEIREDPSEASEKHHQAEAFVSGAYAETDPSVHSTGAIVESRVYRVQHTIFGTYYGKRHVHGGIPGTHFRRRVVGAVDVDLPSTLEATGFPTLKGRTGDSTSILPYSVAESSSGRDHPLPTATSGSGVAATSHGNPTRRGSSTKTPDDVDLATSWEVFNAPVDVAMEESEHRLTPSPSPTQDEASLVEPPLATEQGDGWEVGTPDSYEAGTGSAASTPANDESVSPPDRVSTSPGQDWASLLDPSLATEQGDGWEVGTPGSYEAGPGSAASTPPAKYETLSAPDSVSTAPAQAVATASTSGDLIASDTLIVVAMWAMTATVGIVCLVVAFIAVKVARRHQPEIDLCGGGEQISPDLVSSNSMPAVGPEELQEVCPEVTPLIELPSAYVTQTAGETLPPTRRSSAPPTPVVVDTPSPCMTPTSEEAAPPPRRSSPPQSPVVVELPSAYQTPTPTETPSPTRPSSAQPTPVVVDTPSACMTPTSEEASPPPRPSSPPSSPEVVEPPSVYRTPTSTETPPSTRRSSAPPTPVVVDTPSACMTPTSEEASPPARRSSPPSSPVVVSLPSAYRTPTSTEKPSPTRPSSAPPTPVVVDTPSACMTPTSEEASPPPRPSSPPSSPEVVEPPSVYRTPTSTGKPSPTRRSSAPPTPVVVDTPSACMTPTSEEALSPPRRPSSRPPPPPPPTGTAEATVGSTVILDAATEETPQTGCRFRKPRKQKVVPSAAEVVAAQSEKATLKSNREGKRQARKDKRQTCEAAMRALRAKTAKAKGGSTETTAPPRPDGSLASTLDLETGSASVKGPQGPKCPDSFSSSTPVSAADNIVRSGCGASGAARGNVRGSGVPGRPASSAIVSTTSFAAGLRKTPALPTSGAALSSNAGSAGAQKPRRTGKSALDWTSPENPPSRTGLTNKLNRCAINVAFQVFRHDSALRQALVGVGEGSPTEGTLGALMGKTFTAMEKPGGKGFVHPTVMTNISEFFELTANGQLDAGEVIMYLLNKLRDDADNAGDTSVKAALEGMTGDTHYVCVCKCGAKSRASDPFSVLPVPMEQLPSDGGGKGDGGGSVHLPDLLDKVFAEQMVETCEACLAKGESTRDGKSRLPVLAHSPDRLMLQLGRFSGDDNGERQKLTHLVTVPKVLNVGPHTKVGKGSGDEVVLYDLDAVVHHTSRDHQPGDVEQQRGHYTVCTRTGADTWCRYNDNQISTVKTSEALTEDAYILSYHKRL